jgi:GNAT superfamily N-acetyltransferase
MVFWKSFPVSMIWKACWSSDSFIDLQFEKESMLSPTGFDAKWLHPFDKTMKTNIRLFLRAYFGSPPSTPILDIPENYLLSTQDHLLYLQDSSQEIIGCIRYHYLGTLQHDKSPPMYVVDCFCIHPTWRKKGVGDYLLSTLHRYANQHHIPYCLFLKEGPSLSIMSFPFYSSQYVYKKVESSSFQAVTVISWKEAYRWMDEFQKIGIGSMVIRKDKPIHPQYWRKYQKDNVIILACIQYAFQWFVEDNKKQTIGWMTGWLETSNATNQHREEAMTEIANSMYGTIDYVWGDQCWIGESKQWKKDGFFHWYAYQWSTSIHLKKNYCILY